MAGLFEDSHVALRRILSDFHENQNFEAQRSESRDIHGEAVSAHLCGVPCTLPMLDVSDHSLNLHASSAPRLSLNGV